MPQQAKSPARQGWPGQGFSRTYGFFGICRNALCFMAAPSVGRRSRQRQGVIPYEGIENGGLDLFKAAVM